MTREQVSVRFRAGREGGRGVGGEVHKSSWHLPYLLPVVPPVGEGRGGSVGGKSVGDEAASK